jgi:hypothetical protein
MAKPEPPKPTPLPPAPGPPNQNLQPNVGRQPPISKAFRKPGAVNTPSPAAATPPNAPTPNQAAPSPQPPKSPVSSPAIKPSAKGKAASKPKPATKRRLSKSYMPLAEVSRSESAQKEPSTSKRGREENTQNHANEPHVESNGAPSPKRVKTDEENETEREQAQNEAELVEAYKSTANAMASFEASLAPYASEMQPDPGLNEFLQQLSSILGPGASNLLPQSILDLATPQNPPPRPPSASLTSGVIPSNPYDEIFDISFLLNEKSFADDDEPNENDTSAGTPELVQATASQEPTPSSIAESPASGAVDSSSSNSSNPNSSPAAKALRASATGGDKPIAGERPYDMWNEIDVPEGKYYLDDPDWKWEGEMTKGGEWPGVLQGGSWSITEPTIAPSS